MSDANAFTEYFKQRFRNGNSHVHQYDPYTLNCKDLVGDVLAFQFLSTGKHSDLNMLVRSCHIAEQQLVREQERTNE